MRLKTLEIKGFKSFVDHTTIHFNEEVTGIVGPNGAGKSNIVDAIRWVLGEQKISELRLEKMDEVLFNGSKNRKQGNLAFVSVTFDNTKNIVASEYNQIKISRYLYRTGESEYRLNDVICRLKDIQSLLMDTGIGSTSYAIIALGMVDDILKDKDNSRRKMFEQASGISKYKQRKHQTLLKLKSTSQDLERIEDLLFEIEGNMKDLEKQAKRTKRFYDLKSQYKTLKIEWTKREIGQNENRYKEIGEKLQTQQININDQQTLLRQKEALLEKLKKQNLDKEQALSKAQKRINSLLDKIRTSENNKAILAQKQQFYKSEVEMATREMEFSKTKLKSISGEIKVLKDNSIESKSEFEKSRSILSKLENDREQIVVKHGNIKVELEVLLESKSGLDHEIFDLEKTVAVFKNQQELLTKSQEQLKIEKVDKKSEAKNLAVSIKNSKKEILKTVTIKNKLIDDIKKIEERISESEEKIEIESEQKNKLYRKIDAQKNEYNLLKNMVEKLDGFPESIKFLNQQEEWGEKAPLLSDIFYTKEEYRVLLEQILESYLDFYVVEDYKDAMQAITLLSEAQKGKAKFFILNSFQDFKIQSSRRSDLLSLLDVVEVEQEYQKLAEYLLGHVYISDKQGIEILDDTVIVNSEGNVVQSKYQLAGGSIGLFEGKKIGRKKRVEKLEKDLNKLQKEAFKVEKNLEKSQLHLKNLKSNNLQDQIDSFNDELAVMNSNLATQESLYGSHQNSISRIDNNFLDIATQISKLREEIILANEKLSVLQKEQNKSKKEIGSQDKDFDEYTMLLNQLENKYNNQKILTIQTESKLLALQKEIDYRRQRSEELEKTISENTSRISDRKEELASIEKESENISKQLLELYNIRKQDQGGINKLEQNYYQSRGEINEVETAVKDINKASQNAQFVFTELKEERNRIKYELTSMTERVNIEFGIALDEILKAELDLSIDDEELESKTERLKSRLENYGEINPMALEAYDEINERYTSIYTQREDILAAKESLLETIKEIDETATAAFMSAFESIKTHFKDVFRSLFSAEDFCDIILLDPENPLQSNIEIIAKPKGKKPKSLSQLSGGEKTLTATALLFSLYLLKPAPFCIFDEVDAPLDDVNVFKFNKIIKEFSGESQFIIVTHNKLTMAEQDVIYGVYMEESGVSKVSKVDFRTYDHDIISIPE